MDLAHVERLCRENEIPCEYIELGLVVTKTGEYPNLYYPILISEEGANLQAFIYFPKCSVSQINRVEELCKTLQETFEGDVEVGFTHERNRFWLGRILEEDPIEDLAILADVCDIAFPICMCVSSLGEWDDKLINLACLPRDSMHHA